MGFQKEGSSGNVQDVDVNHNALVALPGHTAAGVPRGGGQSEAGDVALFSEIDEGVVTGVRELISPETDTDGRLRVTEDHLLDQEFFNYTTHNTSKHTFTFTTMAATCTAAGITTNSGSVTTTSIGLTFGTFAAFPVGGNQTTICETSASFTALANDNTNIDFGLFLRGATTAFAPSDGIYFRLSPAGWQGVANNNGSEVATTVFKATPGGANWTHALNTIYRFKLQVNNTKASFFINGVKMGEIPTPVGSGFLCSNVSLPWSFRHAIVGGVAGAICSAVFSDYKVMVRGAMFAQDMGSVGNRIYGSYQYLSGQGAVGQMMAGTVTTGTLVKPTAAVPLNTSLAANLAAGLSGRSIETLSSGLAVNVDGILAQYQVPAGTNIIPGRRLKIVGLKLSSIITTVIGGGTAGSVEVWIGYGNTATSLQTAETGSMVTATTKAPRRVFCPSLTQHYVVTQAADTGVAQNAYYEDFSAAPIYVNAGEFVEIIICKSFTTIPTSGIVQHAFQFVYSWE
jgi:hypothetical protein